ncbi:Oxysterol-binding_protein [Hexamita inflata]|uniref:Oxysterol-binding protein n=1 Tax=Hexamita inflata TaxID=28002 RepID=A0AA86ULS8_9EUKA|nr:Oxysterol-binding protein [Hexamita inflata]
MTDVMDELKNEQTAEVFLQGNGGICFNSQVIQQAQRDLGFELVKKAGKNLFKGKGIMRMSLPPRKNVFDTRTQLETASNDNFTLGNLIRAAQQQGDERKDLCLRYYFDILLETVLHQLKPFNPLMGETYADTCELQVDNQTYTIEVEAEQVQNHPPTSLYNLKVSSATEELFTLYGCASLDASLFMNHSDVVRTGFNRVVFARNLPQVFEFTHPTLRVYGLFYGQRWCHFMGKSQLTFYQNNFRVSCAYIREHEKLTINGEQLELTFAKSESMFKSATKDHVFGKLNRSKISGSVMGEIFKDENVLWNNQKIQQNIVVKTNGFVFSDGRNRLDVILFKDGKDEEADKNKNILEERQRADRKLRGCE